MDDGKKKPVEANDNEERQNGDNMDNNGHQDNDQAQKDQPKVSSSTCKAVATQRPKVEFPSHRINARI